MTKTREWALGVYTVVSDDSGHDVRVDIGRAVPHPDGRGFDLRLRALPLGARVLLREPSLEQSDEHAGLSLAQQVEAFERAAIELCLIETGGNIAAALERLQVPRRTLNEKMARLGIDRRRLALSLRERDADTAESLPATESHNGATPAGSDLDGRSATPKRSDDRRSPAQ
jgi:regulatory Fis family protein